MALSGNFYTNINNNWRLQGEWTATQNVSGNYSDITLKVYFMGLNSYGTTYSSASKSGSSTINGTSSAFTFNAKITGAEKKLIHTQSVRINHNADGTKVFSLSAYADIELTLNGTYYGRVSIASGNQTLNTIPRASKVTAGVNFTLFTQVPTISISRSSSNFTHTVKVYAGSNWIKDVTGVGTSTTISFTQAEFTSIMSVVGTGGSVANRIVLQTYNGGTHIGTSEVTGIITIPNSSTATFSGGATKLQVGSATSLNVSRAYTEFSHTIAVRTSDNTVVATHTNIWEWLSWTPTTAQQNIIIGKIGNNISVGGSLLVTTFYNGKQIRSATTTNVTFNLDTESSKPTFPNGIISYLDSNTTTVGITGNNQYIIQGYSNLKINITSGIVGKNNATITKVEALVGNTVKSITSTSGTIDMGVLNLSSNVTATISATDSRGLTTSQYLPINIVPYSKPKITADISRIGGFEETVVPKISGSISPLLINGVVKNNIKTETSLTGYQYKISTVTSYNTTHYGLGTRTPSTLTSTGIFSYATGNLGGMGVVNSYNFKVSVTDLLSTTTVFTYVPNGKPIMFVDSANEKISIGRFTDSNKAILQVGGDILADGDIISLGAIVANNGIMTSGGIAMGTSGVNPSIVRQNDNSIYLLGGGSGYSIKFGMYGATEISSTSANIDFLTSTRFASGMTITGGTLGSSTSKFSNGYNFLSGYSTGNGTYLIQSKLVPVVLANAVYAFSNFTWDVAFASTPYWVVATAQDSNSFQYSPSIYTPTSTGGTVYLSNVSDKPNTLTIYVRIVACGIKN